MEDSTSPTGDSEPSEPVATGPHSVQLQEWISCAPFEQHLGMEIEEAADGAATLRMPFRYQLAQGDALMHGGALLSLADTALVMAIKSTLPRGTRFVTVTANVDYLAPVTEGNVTAKAKLTRREDRKLFGDAAVFDDSEQQVIAFSAMFVVLKDQ